MPKPYGATMKGKAERWLRDNADGRFVTIKVIARELKISRSSVYAALKHLQANKSIIVDKHRSNLKGKNQRWWIDTR